MINWFRRIISRLIPSSTASRAATVTGALLLTMMIAAMLLGPTRVWKDSRPEFVALLWVLFGVITGLVYGLVRFWGEAPPSEYPEIDRAWQEGLEALKQVGISLSQGEEPLFLVLGNGAVEEVFVEHMRASGEEFCVSGVPAGEGLAPALRWYATNSAIYVFSSDVGTVATLARKWTTSSHDQEVDWGKSLDAGELTPRPRSSSSHLVKSVRADQLGLDEDTPPETSTTPPRSTPSSVGLPTHVDVAEQVSRISYLCQLVKRSRWPRCGLNGVVALLPFELSVAHKEELEAMAGAIRSDMRAIHRTLWLRYPVVGLVVGMEQAVGFNEFSSLLGKKSAINMRLGSGYNVHRRATSERLQWLSDRICDSFEDFLYALFKRPAALSSPAENRKLYHLLCRVRRQIKPQLNQILSNSFGKSGSLGWEEGTGRQDGRPAVYFGGCYLAGTGEMAEGQAFVKGVLFDKLKDEQHRVEWTDEARSAQAWFKVAVWCGWIVFGGLLVLLVVGSAVW